MDFSNEAPHFYRIYPIVKTFGSNNRLIKVGGLETQKANHYVSDWLLYDLVVGAVGFEPTASCSQGVRP